MYTRENPGPNIGTRVLAEHDTVKVWELVLEPGESSQWHRHKIPFVLVAIEPGPLRMENADGTEQVREFAAGDVVYLAPCTHRVTNVGNTRYRNVIIELKG